MTQDDGWYVGQVLESQGVTTQGKTLDELVFMVRDAISLMWDETDVQLELIIPGERSVAVSAKRASVKSKVGRKRARLEKFVPTSFRAK